MFPLAGKHFGTVWLDPVMGIVGACLITQWAWGLVAVSGRVLLDMQAPEKLRAELRRHIEADADNRLADFHIWAIGPGIYSASISLITAEPQPIEYYRKLIPPRLGISHLTIEVHRWTFRGPSAARPRA